MINENDINRKVEENLIESESQLQDLKESEERYRTLLRLWYWG